jgi:hypothetical protein
MPLQSSSEISNNTVKRVELQDYDTYGYSTESRDVVILLNVGHERHQARVEAETRRRYPVRLMGSREVRDIAPVLPERGPVRVTLMDGWMRRRAHGA